MTVNNRFFWPIRELSVSGMTGSTSVDQGRARVALPRVIWALAACHLVISAGGFGRTFLVLYLTQDRRLSASSAGAVAAAVGLGTIGSLMLGGWLSDRIGRRPIMLAGFLGTALALIGLGSARSMPAIWATAIGVGLTSELFRPAGSATVADLPRPQERIRAFGLLFWAASLGFSVSAVAAGVLVRHGYELLFWLNATAAALAALVAWHYLPEPAPHSARRPARGLLAVVVRDRPMIAIALIFVAYFSLFQQAFTTLPLAMSARGLGPGTYGAVLAVNGIVTLIAQPFAVRLLHDRERYAVLAASMLLVGIGLGLGAVVHTVDGYLGSALVWTAGEIGIAVMYGAVFADLAPADLRGGYMGLAATTWAVGNMLGPLLGTAVLDRGGQPALWLTCAALGITLFLALRRLTPALRQRTSAPSGPSFAAAIDATHDEPAPTPP